MAKKYFVSGDQHYRITGQLLEIQRQLRTKDGSPIDPEKARIELQEIIEPGYKKRRRFFEDTLPQGISHLVLERVRASGYLDTSFDGREVHPLVIRPLAKEQAFAEYRAGDGEPWVWNELEDNMPYVVPEVKWLNVMILDFGKDFPSNGVDFEMDNLDVRPLAYEELIQYGIVYPEHQKQNLLLGLGTRSFFIPLLPCSLSSC